MNGKPVTFTATEIEGLEQIVSAGHRWLDGSNPAYPDLILKMGRAFLEVQDGAVAHEMYLSEMEAWYLREIVPTNLRVKGETIGLAIKARLYPVLLDFDAEKYSAVAGGQYGFSTVEEPLTRKDAIQEQGSIEPELPRESSEALPESGDMTTPLREEADPDSLMIVRDLIENRQRGDGDYARIARETGLHIALISRVMNGARRPSLRAARVLAAYFGITVEELCRELGVGDGFPNENSLEADDEPESSDINRDG